MMAELIIKPENNDNTALNTNPDIEAAADDINPVQENDIKLDTSSGEKEEDNPYAYLERDFSSEKFKIEVKNMPKFYGMSEFKKLLNEKLKLGSSKVKMPRRNSPYIFVCFSNEEEKENAIKVLCGYKWKGKLLNAIKAKPSPDPLVKRRQQDAENESCKRIKLDKSVDEAIKESTIPLWNVPYEEQLKTKYEDIKSLLMRLGNQLHKENPYLREWIDGQKAKFDGLPCELLDIRHSEKYDEYRNKCEFTVGINEETGLPTVGFRLSSYAKGVVSVGPIENLRHIPKAMKAAVQLFEEFVRSHELQVFNPELQTGHFRQLTARIAADQLMLIVAIHPQGLNEKQLERFKTELKEYFSSGPGKDAKVTSLYYQYLTKRKTGGNSEDSSPVHLHGETHIHDTILGLKFRISPEAFFQINSSCAEVLYKSAIELAAPTLESTVVDVCCGTGTIGLCFAKSSGQVLGLEIVPQAVHDAKENAKANGIENSEFFGGKAEDILTSVFYRSKKDDVIAVVDPPRAGLHGKAISMLRKIDKLKKLVYISCNPNAAFANFVQMGRPQSKNLFGEPLVPVKAVPVDMFPHTKHCELAIFFQRWSPDMMNKE